MHQDIRVQSSLSLQFCLRWPVVLVGLGLGLVGQAIAKQYLNYLNYPNYFTRVATRNFPGN